jgi:hypothetical protein
LKSGDKYMKTPHFRAVFSALHLSSTHSGASGDTELFEKASNINGFQGGRVANNLYISPFRATVFKTAALFLYLNSSVVIRVRKPLFFPL